MVGGKRMNWMENLLMSSRGILLGVSSNGMPGIMVAKINKKNLQLICGIRCVAILLVAKYDDVSFAKSLGTVVTERLIDTLTILLITGITFLMQMPVFLRFFEETGTKVPSLVHLVTSPWFYVVLFSIIGVLVLLYFLLRMLSFFEKVKGVVLNVWEGVMSLKSVKNIPLFLLYTVLIWGCYFYHFYITPSHIYSTPHTSPHPFTFSKKETHTQKEIE